MIRKWYTYMWPKHIKQVTSIVPHTERNNFTLLSWQMIPENNIPRLGVHGIRFRERLPVLAWYLNTGCKRWVFQGLDSTNTATFKEAKTYSMKLISLDTIFSSEHRKWRIYSMSEQINKPPVSVFILCVKGISLISSLTETIILGYLLN